MSKQLSPERRAARSVAKQAADRQRELEARSRSRWFNPWVLGGIAVALAGASLAVALTSSGGSSAPRTSRVTETQAWRDAALVDLRPLTGNVVQLGRTVTDWQAGRTSAADAAGALDGLLPRLAEAQAAIATRPRLSGFPRAGEDLALTAALYLQAARVARVATDVPVGPLRTQLQRQFFRVRDLADRYFDQAGVELEPVLGRARQVEGVEVRRTAEVPDWRSNGLAAGPPLDATTPPTSLRTYQETRPQESFADWATDVSDADVPTAAEETAGLHGDSAAALARRFVAASDSLYAAPDPRDERVVSTRLQLALLVHAEALRAAQAATLLPAQRAALLQVANQLTALGDRGWDARLGTR